MTRMTRLLKKKRPGEQNRSTANRIRFDTYGNVRDQGCALPVRARTLNEAGADWSDAASLNLFRIMLRAITEGDPHGWITAYDLAEELFDATNGPVIATLVAKTLRAIRNSRQSGFRFNTPCCPDCARHLTEEEAHLITALRALRQHKIASADNALQILCENADNSEVTLWLRELAMALPPLAPARLN